MDNKKLADALRKFGKIPEGRQLPTNAITLWHHIVEGVHRVADALENKGD